MSKKKLQPDTIAESRSCPECRKSSRGECSEHWKKRIQGGVLPEAEIAARVAADEKRRVLQTGGRWQP